MTTAELLNKMDRLLAAKGIVKKPFTATANGLTATVTAYNFKEARRIVGNMACR